MPRGPSLLAPLAFAYEPPRAFSWPTLLVLLAILVASCATFWALVRRWTTYRVWADLQTWADNAKMTLHGRGRATLPAPLSSLADPQPIPVLSITGPTAAVVEMRTLRTQRTDTSQYTRWHAVVRGGLEATAWPPTGLRPRANRSSLLDLFPLTSFPSMLPPERFVVFGTDSAAARRVARSKLPALLPPDVGLLLHGSSVVLDFSSRPFDTIELSRMSELAEQLLAHLPAFE